VELFIPAKKGRSHTLRLIREILFFEPQGRRTDPALALKYLNRVVTRRAVVFFISDFQTGDFSRELAITGRRHDFIALHIQDERERVLPNVGIITLEDAETGEQIEINTADKATRTHFAELAAAQAAELQRTLHRNNIDAVALQTGRDYLPALRSFFKQRERRMAIR
jgi:uncharacterized protein (DUF58 family)